jgi:hypothetical protein
MSASSTRKSSTLAKKSNGFVGKFGGGGRTRRVFTIVASSMR